METLTHDCERVAVYSDEGDTYLFHRWTINAEVVLGPEFTNYSSVQQPPQEPAIIKNPFGIPIPVGNLQEQRRQVPASAIVTDGNIRDVLLKPRQKLRFYEKSNLTDDAKTEYLLDLPKANESCDVNSGPHPVCFNIVRIIGHGQTVVANFQIQAYERDPDYSKGDPNSVLLYNGWKETHELDPDFFVTRIVEGVAHFRADAIERLGLVVDAWRPNLFQRIPRGFKRENIAVSLRENQRTIDYSYVDKQQRATLVDATGVGVTRANVELIQVLSKPNDGISSVIDTYSSIFEYRQMRNFAREERDAEEKKTGSGGGGRGRSRRRRRRPTPPNTSTT